MRDNTGTIRHFIRNWQQIAKPRGDDLSFYQVLKDFDARQLAPGGDAMIGIVGKTTDEDVLLKLWEGWAMFIRGQEEPALRIFRTIAKALPRRPEPWILTGMAAMLQGDRKNAINAFQTARSLAPDIEPVANLLKKLGTRSKPAIPFLKRENPINIALGKRRAAKLKKTANF